MHEQEDRRIFDYFVVAGLGDDPQELNPGAEECGCKNATPQAPVTDICVIFPGLGESTPEGFTCIETTPSGYPADLNHGSIRTNSVYLCYRRGHHKPPLVDIGVLFEGKGERCMVDSQVVQTTPYGRPANVNNSSQGIYLTYRRAAEQAPPNLLAVTDVCVILMNKGEQPPHTFCRITKNLNKGMVGSDVYICYKKSHAGANRIQYKPSMLDRFPVTDDAEYPLSPNVPIFCLPMGAVVECWPAKCQTPAKLFSTFVLTDEKGRKCYGAAVQFYETHQGTLSTEQLERLGVAPDSQVKTGSCSDNSSTNDPAEQMSFQTNRAICVVSRYPFFVAFKRFLFYLYRMSVTGAYPLPVERYVSHLMFEVPFPTPRRPRVLVQLGVETVSFDSYDDSPLPLSGAAFTDILKNLNPDNCMYILLLALCEQKILIHSLRPWLLTSVAESICSVIFPFHWQCPYIPQCPLDLAGVLHAPLPFIAGVDSRYFELYEDPPKDVTCIDLDTATISQSDVRKLYKTSMFPRRPAKLLRQSLENLYRRAHQEDWNVCTMRNSQEFMPIDTDYKIQSRRRALELEIQEAFLRFMAQIMKGYATYLQPIKAKPRPGTTDTGALFNLDGFMRSRDKSGSEFYKKFQDTQMFIRFIEERSLLTDKNAYLAFFDDCVEKVDPTSDRAEPRLLEYESSLNSNHTVFIAPPEPPNLKDSEMHTYPMGFPRTLDPDKFQLESLETANTVPIGALGRTPMRQISGSGIRGTPAVRRTKQEAKSAQKVARQHLVTPLRWAKCVLSYAYSLWFAHLPSYVHNATSKTKALRTALGILDRMQSARLPVLDEVCYRVLMEVCSRYGRPYLTVKVYLAMRQYGLQPNAITYGIYNKAVLEANWPSSHVLNAEKTWTKLRHAIRAIALLKRAMKEGRRQRRTLSMYSQDSQDVGLSQTSLLSSHSQNKIGAVSDAVSIGTGVSTEATNESTVTLSTAGNDKTSDRADLGYHSQTTEDSISLDRNDDGSISQSQPSLVCQERSSVASNCLTESHLEAFDEFRSSKGRCIIKPNTLSITADTCSSNNDALTSYYDNPTGLSAYESSAGLLMTTQSVNQKDRVSRRDSRELKEKSRQAERNSFIGSATGGDLTPMQESVSSLGATTDADALGSDAHIVLAAKQQDERKRHVAETKQNSLDELAADSLEGIPEEASCTKFMMDSPMSDDSRSISVSPTKLRRTPVTDDPLGVFHLEQTPPPEKEPPKKVIPPSPSRAALMEMQKPFEGEEYRVDSQQQAVSSAGRSSMRGWLNKLTIQSTPVVSRLMQRSATVGNQMDTPDGKAQDTISRESIESTDALLTTSPSWSQAMYSAGSRVRSKVGEVVVKQQPQLSRLRSGVSSMLQGSLKSVRGNLDQLGSPLKGSFNSLNLDGTLANMGFGDDVMQVARGEDSSSLKDEEVFFKTWPQEEGNHIEFPRNDPAFQLSSGQTGAIVAFDLLTNQMSEGLGLAGVSQSITRDLVEVTMCSTTRCESCQKLLHDEEIMAGWSAEESNLNTRCQFCRRAVVPVLSIKVRHHRCLTVAKTGRKSHDSTSLLEEQEGESGGGASRLGGEEGVTVLPPAVARSWYVPEMSSKQTPGPSGNRATKLLLPDDEEPGTSTSAESLEESGQETPKTVRRQISPSRRDAKGIKKALFPKSSLEEETTDSTDAANLLEELKQEEETKKTTPEPPTDRRKNQPICVKETAHSYPYLSPLFLRKETENILASDELSLSRRQFMDDHPILFWNLIYFFQRLCVPTHLTEWIVNAKNCEMEEDSVVNKLPRVIVRCVYDTPELHEQQAGHGRPLYATALALGGAQAPSPLVAALVLEQRHLQQRQVLEAIRQALAVTNLNRAIRLVVRELEKRSLGVRGGRRALPIHLSVYRDVQFLALLWFGKLLQMDNFDREYVAAWNALAPAVGHQLEQDDQVPNLGVRACRKVFIPLDVC